VENFIPDNCQKTRHQKAVINLDVVTRYYRFITCRYIEIHKLHKHSNDASCTVTGHFTIQVLPYSVEGNIQTRDGRIVIFCQIPDSVNRRLISGRFRIRIRIFDVTLPLVCTYKNYSKSRPMLYFSVIFNRQSCQIIKSLLIHQIHIV